MQYCFSASGSAVSVPIYMSQLIPYSAVCVCVCVCMQYCRSATSGHETLVKRKINKNKRPARGYSVSRSISLEFWPARIFLFLFSINILRICIY